MELTLGSPDTGLEWDLSKYMINYRSTAQNRGFESQLRESTKEPFSPVTSTFGQVAQPCQLQPPVLFDRGDL